jgi:predicted N-acetyltransferase YhbS
MVAIRHETRFDAAAREALLDAAFGDGRAAKTAQRLRDGRLPADDLAFVACDDGEIVGTVRLWPVAAGPGRAALLLGPLAVARRCRDRGIGAALVRHALGKAQSGGHGVVLLVGDAPYYGRFGFASAKTGGLWLAGPYERHRLLACELHPGALDDARGLVGATGRPEPKPDLAALVNQLADNDSPFAPRAARAS